MTQWANYEAPNLGLLFYKRIYSENKHLASIQDGEMIFNVNKDNSQFTPYYNDLYNMSIKSYSLPDIDGNKQEFTLYTTYPGLIAGIGYAHGSKSVGDAAIGFYFDHTTGLPTIPGSSVKGVLRSLFELDSDGKKEFTGDKSEAAIRFIIDEYEKHSGDTDSFAEVKESINANLLERLKIEIFGNQDDEGKDVFYDAVIDIENTTVDKFLDSDFITPHYPNLLKNPTPTQFLKVLPNVGFKFRFNLKNDGVLNISQKTALFRQILLTIGIGAKTNVGYGQFKEV
ncbi:MAG: type III-B CRISPR module RAMP protein Cmr6 [Acholeplasmataceae bacterium]|nr:type III-B CRISPR module RAMP protein Cmr6 [Acholeplasmataceae bacterium]